MLGPYLLKDRTQKFSSVTMTDVLLLKTLETQHSINQKLSMIANSISREDKKKMKSKEKIEKYSQISKSFSV